MSSIYWSPRSRPRTRIRPRTVAPAAPDPLPDVADLCPVHRECRAKYGLPVKALCGYVGLADTGDPLWMRCRHVLTMPDGSHQWRPVWPTKEEQDAQR